MALGVNIIILLSLVVFVGGPDDLLQLGVEATLDSALRPAGERLLQSSPMLTTFQIKLANFEILVD